MFRKLWYIELSSDVATKQVFTHRDDDLASVTLRYMFLRTFRIQLSTGLAAFASMAKGNRFTQNGVDAHSSFSFITKQTVRVASAGVT